jgi:hypothetical protein
MPEIIPLPADDAAWLAQLQERIHYAQQRATLAVNREWSFADAWPDGEFVQVVRAQLPWYHQLALLKHGATFGVAAYGTHRRRYKGATGCGTFSSDLLLAKVKDAAIRLGSM